MAKKESPANPDGLAKEIGKKEPFDLLEREVFLNLARTFSIVSTEFEKLFKSFGITSVQYNALRILRGHGAPVSIYQIGEQMITRQPDMPRLVDRLVGMELAAKQRCENDRRVVWVTLTTKGKSLLKKIDQPLDQLHRKRLEHMSKAQIRSLNDLLWLARHPDT
ncbi:MAG: MarR family transcriptional regulator [Planctomycetota bacterium]